MSDQDETLPCDIYLGHIVSPPQRVEVDDELPYVVQSTVNEADEADPLGYDPDFWKLPADQKPEVALLDEAKQIITADRQDQYGDAEDSFSTIGQFWTTFLRARHPRLDIPAIKGSDVALMLDLMKTARQAVTNKHDNLVDKAGYTALAARCVEREKD